jgi:hypothetical protein
VKTSKPRITAAVEELVFYALLLVSGAIPVLGALRTGAEIGAEATIGLVLVGLALSGFAVTAARALHRKT